MSCSFRIPVLAVLASIALAVPARAADAAATEATEATETTETTEDCRNARIIPTADNLARVRAATLCLLNAERERRDIAPLRASAQLRKAATAWSRTMVRQRFFAHESPDGSTMLSRVRRRTSYLSRSVRDWALGENLGWGTGSMGSPQHMVRSWMASARHRKNVLDPSFRHVGIGVVIGTPGKVRERQAATYTTDFGFRTL